MEKEKYYTPDIEEFHVGFEYFCRQAVTIPDGTEHVWKKEVLTKDNISFLFSRLENNMIKVKYLDQEDIESLGFEENIFGYWLNSKLLTIDISDNVPYITISNGGIQTDEVFYFQGIIKNKSELKKLLKQLGI